MIKVEEGSNGILAIYKRLGYQALGESTWCEVYGLRILGARYFRRERNMYIEDLPC